MKSSFLCFWVPWKISTKMIAGIGPLSKMVKLELMANDYSTLLHNKSIYILLQSDCFMYQGGIWQTLDTLSLVVTRRLTRGCYSIQNMRGTMGLQNLVIHTPDTGVFILMLCFLGEIGELYMKTGKGNKKRVINIDAVKKQIELAISTSTNSVLHYWGYTGLQNAIRQVHLLAKVKLSAATCYERIFSFSKP